MWTKFQIIISIILVITGTINTITAKWADSREARGFDNAKRPFSHPYLQSALMFIGESALLIVYKVAYFIFEKKGMDVEESVLTKGNRDFKLWILLVPAWCDMTGTTLMLIGLVQTYASSYQMLKGSVIVFTGLLTIIFLKKILTWKAWLGIAFLICGLGLIGMADYLVGGVDSTRYTTGDIILGDCLIILGNLIISFQYVYEEKFVKGLNINACQAVGWEGIFGFVTIAILCIPFYFIHVGGFSDNFREVIEDIPEAFVQMWNDYIIIILLTVFTCSVCFCNFAGISITKELSATTRTVLDTIRTFFIYLFSLFLFNQKFHWFQVAGFIALLIGMCLYNNITVKWLTKKCKKYKDEAHTGRNGSININSKHLSTVE